MNWLKYIKQAFEILEGESSLKDLYSTIYKLAKEAGEPIDKYTDYQAQIRKTIYLHSSVCDIYDGKKLDFFMHQKVKIMNIGQFKTKYIKVLKKL